MMKIKSFKNSVEPKIESKETKTKKVSKRKIVFSRQKNCTLLPDSDPNWIKIQRRPLFLQKSH